MSTTTAASPAGPAAMSAGWGQSLADGAPGIALLHIARAHAGLAGWEPVHRLAQAMTREPIQAHPEITNLFQGAPAVAYALHTAGHPGYHAALAKLDHSITDLIHARLDAAHRRIDRGQLAHAREYDLINGLTGLGTYLLHREDRDLLRDVLAYLVRLIQPIRVETETLPGWWAAGSPDRRQSPRWDDGHAGFGMAHGIAGPLALLSAAMRRGVTVAGHGEAIRIICIWLDQWRTGQSRQTCWPEVISRDELHAGTRTDLGSHRPSWCYGTPGIARALQLAGLAIGDPYRAWIAEQALLGCLTDDRQLAHLTDAGLCHGWAGLIHTARRAAADATSDLSVAVAAAVRLMDLHVRDHGLPADDGFLEGATGIELVTMADDSADTPAGPNWNTCLLTG
ncbi:lanthionine synthetase C family protein [Actinoplanes sp. NPDC051859]|uniref:lanthionine synthetase C family protein n=1 Tax=Actinoplanes sp. NPDC051859 TaxID=3363909 RepID=UPI003796B690